MGSWTISGWYYTCQAGEYQVIDRQFSSAKEYLSIRVDGNGQYFVNLLLEQTLTNKQFETGIFTSSGWNYFALSLERTTVVVYGVTQYFNTVKFYAGHSQFEVTSINLQNLQQVSAEVTRAKLKYFTSTWERVTANKMSVDCVDSPTQFHFGSRHFANPNLHSGFMHGYFHSLKIYQEAVSIEVLQHNDFTSKIFNFNCIQLIVRDLAGYVQGMIRSAILK